MELLANVLQVVFMFMLDIMIYLFSALHRFSNDENFVLIMLSVMMACVFTFVAVLVKKIYFTR